MRESELLQTIYQFNDRLPANVIVPPGDDMAAIELPSSTLLVAVDQLVEGVHFQRDKAPLSLIGRKAVARNLSDIAAMAALPVGAVVAGALPRDMSAAQANELFESMRKIAEQYDCPLVGGDLSIHDGPLVLSVTVHATPGGVEPVRRSGARVGDAIFVTGELGCAWSAQGDIDAHLTFEPRIQLARRLVEITGRSVRSMIDLSDGLASDLRHICDASDVGAELDANAIPKRQGATLANALQDGEDYELLFTVSPDGIENVPRVLDDVCITRIGRITERNAKLILREQGGETTSIPNGWEHKTQ